MNEESFDVIIFVEEYSLSSIFNSFFEAMKFPDYFSPNWDSFDECLEDAIVENNTSVLVVHNFSKSDLEINSGGEYLHILRKYASVGRGIAFVFKSENPPS